MDGSNWQELWRAHKGKLVGVAAAIVHGFIYLFFGFWDMLFFGLLLWIGYLVGKRADSGLPIVDVRPFLDWLGQRWRPFK